MLFIMIMTIFIAIVISTLYDVQLYFRSFNVVGDEQ